MNKQEFLSFGVSDDNDFRCLKKGLRNLESELNKILLYHEIYKKYLDTPDVFYLDISKYKGNGYEPANTNG